MSWSIILLKLLSRLPDAMYLMLKQMTTNTYLCCHGTLSYALSNVVICLPPSVVMTLYGSKYHGVFPYMKKWSRYDLYEHGIDLIHPKFTGLFTLGMPTFICANKLSLHWLKWWPVTCSTLSHYLNQYWLFCQLHPWERTPVKFEL